MQWTATVRNIQASGSRPQNATIKISLLTRLSESGSGGQSSVTVLCVGREKTKQNKGSRICINTTSLIFSQWWYSRQDMLAILTMFDHVFVPYSGKGDGTYYCLLLSESTFWHFKNLLRHYCREAFKQVGLTWYCGNCPQSLHCWVV